MDLKCTGPIIGLDKRANGMQKGMSIMSRNRIRYLPAVALVVTAGLAAGSGLAPATDYRLVADAKASSKIALVDRGGFIVACGFSHRNQDDPIVFPRQPGRSHDHTFFGNRSTNAFSTAASLRKHRRTSCPYSGGADSAAYWAPTLNGASSGVP